MFSRFLTFFAVLALAPLALAEAALSVDKAWIRALPPVQKTTAAYFSLTNQGTEAVQLVGAKVNGVGRVEIHTSREVDGLVRMEQLSTLDVAAGASQDFAPGGAHLMLFELDAMPQPGDTRTLCLLFANADEVCVEAQVRKSAATGHHHHHH